MNSSAPGDGILILGLVFGLIVIVFSTIVIAYGLKWLSEKPNPLTKKINADTDSSKDKPK